MRAFCLWYKGDVKVQHKRINEVFNDKDSVLKKRGIILGSVLVGLASVLLVSCSGKKSEEDGKADDKPEIVTVQKGDIRVIVEATGRVVPDQEVEIKCKASGEIIQLPVDVSDVVKKGDLLLQLDPEDEERSVKRAKVALAVSQAQQAQSVLSLQIAERDLVTAGVRARATLVSSEAK